MLEIVKSSSSLRKFITNKQANRYCDKTSYTTNLKNYSLNCDHTQACNYLKL